VRDFRESVQTAGNSFQTTRLPPKKYNIASVKTSSYQNLICD